MLRPDGTLSLRSQQVISQCYTELINILATVQGNLRVECLDKQSLFAQSKAEHKKVHLIAVVIRDQRELSV